MPRSTLGRSLLVLTPILAAWLLFLLWLESYSTIRRFIFLPSGDVALGFKSAAGRVQWIEYAPWDRKHLDTPWWSIPYPFLIAGCIAISVAAGAWVRTRRASEAEPPGEPPPEKWSPPTPKEVTAIVRGVERPSHELD